MYGKKRGDQSVGLGEDDSCRVTNDSEGKSGVGGGGDMVSFGTRPGDGAAWRVCDGGNNDDTNGMAGGSWRAIGEGWHGGAMPPPRKSSTSPCVAQITPASGVSSASRFQTSEVGHSTSLSNP